MHHHTCNLLPTPRATTRHKGKEIAKPVTPQSESVFLRKTVIQNKLRGIRDIQKTWHSLLSISRSCTNLPTTTFELLQTPGTRLKIPHQVQFGSATKWIQCIKTAWDLDTMPGKQKPKRADWLEDTDEEIDEQELEAHYSYMAKIQEVSPEESQFLLVSHWNRRYNVIPDSSNRSTNDNQVDKNTAEILPNGEETVTLEKESRSKLDKDKFDELDQKRLCFSNIYIYFYEEVMSKDVTVFVFAFSCPELNANTELQCFYLHKSKNVKCLAQKAVEKTRILLTTKFHNKLLEFAKLEKHSISLELSLQHCKEQIKNNTVCKEKASNVFKKEREQYHEIQDLKAQYQQEHGENELKKLILVTKGNSVETQFE
ncbi:hypothetical protein Tco_0948921 [Tanacetum coccineum]